MNGFVKKSRLKIVYFFLTHPSCIELREHAPYYAGHPVVKSQHEKGAFTWLKIAIAKCLSDTAMSVFENMITQQQLLKKQCIMRIITNSRR
jgi:hypothetical protein